MPVGLKPADVEAGLSQQLARIEGVKMRIVQRYEPNCTAPSHEIVQSVVAAAEQVLHRKPAINMRVGASDARIYRMFHVPSVVFWPAPYKMGGPDEHAMIAELVQVAKVYALAAFRYLSC